MNMVCIFINDKKYIFEEHITIFSACERVGIKIPHFCYHDGLSISGNCRMCLVEVNAMSKPVPSCTTPIIDGMSIKTETSGILNQRQNIMELLLINHPLDCLICDKGGECELQDQAVKYGSLRGCYLEEKRNVEIKNMGPMISTHMNRCIHCTRCIRFVDEVAGTYDIAMINRGEKSEITTFNKPIKSELSANIVDICPVGALNISSYEYTFRAWELSYRNTIDVMDPVCSNIRAEYKDNKIQRILPKNNFEINDWWISDKTRFSFDGIYSNRLLYPYINVFGEIKKISINDAIDIFSNKIKSTTSKRFAAIVGDMVDCESIFILKKLMDYIGAKNIDSCQYGTKIKYTNRSQYIMNTPLNKLEKADAIILIGTNPRIEAPMVNYRIRKAFRENNAKIFTIGDIHDLNYNTTNIGNNVEILNSLTQEDNEIFSIFNNAKKPVVIVGKGVLIRRDAERIISLLMDFAEKTNVVNGDWNGFNVLHTDVSMIPGIDFGAIPFEQNNNAEEIIKMSANGEIDLLFLLGADRIDTSKLGNTFVVYQGTHMNNGFHRADLSIPSVTYLEKEAYYINVNGYLQKTYPVVFDQNNNMPDSEILLKIIHNVIGKKNEYTNIEYIISDMLNSILNIESNTKWKAIKSEIDLDHESPIKSINQNFCTTNVITLNSKTMLEYRNII